MVRFIKKSVEGIGYEREALLFMNSILLKTKLQFMGTVHIAKVLPGGSTHGKRYSIKNN